MRIYAVAIIASLGFAAPALGQCTGSQPVQDVCNRAIDAMKTFHPAAGIIVSGGNPSLGTASTLGGLGHGFLSIRVNAVNVVVPNPDTTNGGSTINGLVPAPVVEAGVGLWRGLTGGLLAIDALLSATLLPTDAVENLRVDSAATRLGNMALGLGYGVRVSALRGAFPIPAVSLSVMRRTLPRVTYGQLAATSLSAGDAFEFAIDLQATNIRLAASYRLPLVDVALGIGSDTYTSRGSLRYYDNPPFNTTANIALRPRNSRQLVFVNAAAHLSVLTLGAEIGYQTGKDQVLSTTYDFDAEDGHVFGGIGLRFAF